MRKKYAPILGAVLLVVVVGLWINGQASTIDGKNLTKEAQIEIAQRILEDEGSIEAMEGFEYYQEESPELEKYRVKDGDKIATISSEIPIFSSKSVAYDMVLNDNKYPVFKDPSAAFEQFLQDYRSELDAIQRAFSLNNITAQSYSDYYTFGWQLGGDTPLSERAAEVSQFLGYYKHSVEK